MYSTPSSADFEQSVLKLQTDMDSLSQWCKCNGIAANTDKTKIMTFGSPHSLKKIPPFDIKIGDTLIQKVTSYKYLGMELDCDLSYKKHVNKIVSSVSPKLKQFQRMLNKKAAIMVYKSTILPILEYGDVFLSAAPLVSRKRLQTLQNKGLRCALNKGIETSSAELHKEAGLGKLRFRREQHLLNYMYDCSLDPNCQKRKLSQGVVTRSQSKRILKVKRPYTEKFKKSFTYRGPKKWNTLPIPFHQATTKATFRALVTARIKQKADLDYLGQLNATQET